MDRTGKEKLWIGEMAEAAGVGVETIRFYEREGLLPEPPRSSSGYRIYGPASVRRVRFIRRAKALGFTLAETKDLLDLRVTDTARCDEVSARARDKLTDVARRIRELQEMRAVLQDLVDACEARSSTDACPILAVLEDPDQSAGRTLEAPKGESES